MSVERNKDGSVTIKHSKGTATIGIIGGVSDKKREEKFEKWVEECTKLVIPCGHTYKETEQYFLELCDAVKLDINDMRMKSFKLNVILNHFKDKLKHQASQFSFDMTDEEIEKWHKEEEDMRDEAMNSSPEDFGLNMSGYYLPHTERNEVFYKEAYLEFQKRMKDYNPRPKQIEMQDICFFFEETTGQFQCSGGGKTLMQQLIVFSGIREEDIVKRTPRFLEYISTLREMGSLPGL